MTKKQATNWTLQGEAIEESLVVHATDISDEWVSEPTVLGNYKHKVASRVKRAFRKESDYDQIIVGKTYTSKRDRGEYSLVTVMAKSPEFVVMRPLSHRSSSTLVSSPKKISTDKFILSFILNDEVDNLMTL